MSNQFNIDGSFDDFSLENDDADEDVVEEKDKNYLSHSLSEDIIGASKNFDDQCGKWYLFSNMFFYLLDFFQHFQDYKFLYLVFKSIHDIYELGYFQSSSHNCGFCRHLAFRYIT